MLTGVGERKPDLAPQGIDTATAVGQDVQNLHSAPIGQGLAHSSELVKKGSLGRPARGGLAVLEPLAHVSIFSYNQLTS